MHILSRPAPPPLCGVQGGTAESRDNAWRPAWYPLRSLAKWVYDNRSLRRLAEDAFCHPFLLKGLFLLILDGHSSHVGYEVRELAVKNQVHLLKLPPHTTHLLQSLDVGFFNCIKHEWQSTVGNFTRRERRVISKRDFPALLGEAWGKHRIEWALGGFKMQEPCLLTPRQLSEASLMPSQCSQRTFHPLMTAHWLNTCG